MTVAVQEPQPKQIDVFCDESRPELLHAPSRTDGRYTLIGGVWVPTAQRERFKQMWWDMKSEERRFEELKWHKISWSTANLYRSAVDLFVDLGLDARFRCVVVDSQRFDVNRHGGDPELGFFKFYYVLLDPWTRRPQQYNVFCDVKTTRVGGRLATLHRILNRSGSEPVLNVQAVPSRESAGIQLVDLLLGAVGARLNAALKSGSAKESIVQYLEQRLGVSVITGTSASEAKFNVFLMQLR